MMQTCPVRLEAVLLGRNASDKNERSGDKICRIA
jgi:hypothetical protein